MSKRKPDIERARAAARLAGDGELRPVHELAALAGASPQGLKRWITAGRGGVYLDGVRDRGVWLSSAAAVRRFHQEYAARQTA